METIATDTANVNTGNMQTIVQKIYGWICPICGRAISPYEKYCPFCHQDVMICEKDKSFWQWPHINTRDLILGNPNGKTVPLSGAVEKLDA